MKHSGRPGGFGLRKLAGSASVLVLAATMVTAFEVTPALAAVEENPNQYVDPFIGTLESTTATVKPDSGNGFPGATAPFGRVQWSPDNTTSQGQSYNYNSNKITGFSITHISGAGCNIGKDVPVSATVGEGNTTNSISYSHTDEEAKPGYYKVRLANEVAVELTATERTGFGKFTFPSTQYANIIVDTSSSDSWKDRSITIDAANKKISGWVQNGNFCGPNSNRYKLYYSFVFDRPFTVTSNSAGKAVLTFDARTNQVVQAKVSNSLVSEANAAANIPAESSSWDFTTVRTATSTAWNNRLRSIQVSGGTADQKKIFYSSLYKSMLHPNVATDSNGQYRGFDGEVHTADGYTHYNNFSGWDVYRSQVQLLAMIAPTVASDWVSSLLADAAQCGGVLPKWSHYNTETNVMVGAPAIPTIASIAAFGATDFDTADALQKMLTASTTNDLTCQSQNMARNFGAYMTRGYQSSDDSSSWWDRKGQSAVTQEHAIADFALAQFAKDQRSDTNTYNTYLERSKNWRNVFDDASGYVQHRNGSGTYLTNTKENIAGMVEGSSAQYTWMVPHDMNNMIQAQGGSSNAVAKLDDLFSKLNTGFEEPYFNIGNEPSFTTPWAYLWAGAPWRTQDVVERIRSGSFTSGAGGDPGNLDLGATSAWYVLAALGIYPAIPGTDVLTMNGPMFPAATVALANNKTLNINAPDTSSTNRYVQSLTVNGTASNKAWTRFSTIKDGATLNFTMGSSRSTWASAAADAPPSFITTSSKPAGDLARGKTATANNTCATSEDAGKAVDGSATTKWCAPTTGRQAWLKLDLGQQQTIDRWVVNHAGSNAENVNWNTKDFRLQSATSTDGPWKDRDTVVGNTANKTDRRLTPTTARYWRILITDPTQISTDSAARVYAVNLYTSTGNIGDLAQGKSSAASASCTTSEDASRALDASATTKWCARLSNGEAWLRADLGRAMNVKRWVVRHAGYGGESTTWNTKDYVLQYATSANGPWTTLDTVTGNTADSTDRTTTATSAQHWRLKITAPTQTTDTAARIYALELYT